jgi:hypothetical protein
MTALHSSTANSRANGPAYSRPPSLHSFAGCITGAESAENKPGNPAKIQDHSRDASRSAHAEFFRTCVGRSFCIMAMSGFVLDLLDQHAHQNSSQERVLMGNTARCNSNVSGSPVPSTSVVSPEILRGKPGARDSVSLSTPLRNRCSCIALCTPDFPSSWRVPASRFNTMWENRGGR